MSDNLFDFNIIIYFVILFFLIKNQSMLFEDM